MEGETPLERLISGDSLFFDVYSKIGSFLKDSFDRETNSYSFDIVIIISFEKMVFENLTGYNVLSKMGSFPSISVKKVLKTVDQASPIFFLEKSNWKLTDPQLLSDANNQASELFLYQS